MPNTHPSCPMWSTTSLHLALVIFLIPSWVALWSTSPEPVTALVTLHFWVKDGVYEEHIVVSCIYRFFHYFKKVGTKPPLRLTYIKPSNSLEPFKEALMMPDIALRMNWKLFGDFFLTLFALHVPPPQSQEESLTLIISAS